MNRSQLRSMIMEELQSLLQDDAIFHDRDEVGVIDKFDIPGDSDSGRNLGYGNTKASDHEGKSTKKELYYIFTKAQSLHDMIHDDDDLPEWVQSKISKVADKVKSVYNYLEYKIHRKDY